MNYYKYNYIPIYFLLFFVITACSDPQMYVLTKSQSNKSIDTLQTENINFYLETSVSMKGYVNSNVSGNYTLKNIVPFLITDLERNYGIETTLHTISDVSRKYRQSKTVFFDQLRNGSLLNGKSSKLQRVFGDVISSTKETDISILVSDCIVDLGKTDTMAEGSLVTNEIYQQLVYKENLGVAVFKYISDFNGGYYYDRENTGGNVISKRPYQGEILKNRPFYIWVFGDKSRVSDLVSKGIIKGYTEAHTYNLTPENIDFTLLEHPKTGKIAINSEKGTLIIKEIDQKRPAQFTIGLHLNKKENPLNKIITTSTNYLVTPSYIQNTIDIQIKDAATLLSENIPNKSQIDQEGYTHFIQPTLSDFDPDTNEIKMSIHNTIPIWIEETNLDDDLDISTTMLEHKTFAFKFILDAFAKAYDEKKPLLEFTLTKQQK
ncbi:hypothetical protein [Dokdonia ponticola]